MQGRTLAAGRCARCVVQANNLVVGAGLTGMPLPCCSLVKKDAHMLDAFGKGASDDIRSAKEELYNQVGAAAQAFYACQGFLMRLVLLCPTTVIICLCHCSVLQHAAPCTRCTAALLKSWTLNVPCGCDADDP